MPTSELSDALNPNVVRQRDYGNGPVYQDQQNNANLHHPNFYYELPQQQPHHEYAPHRSELELAVVEPTPAQRYVPASLACLRCSDNLQAATYPHQSRVGAHTTTGRHRKGWASGEESETHLGSQARSDPGGERTKVSHYARRDRFTQGAHSAFGISDNRACRTPILNP